MSKDPPDEIGYGRPPQSTRFQPGESGNPLGRPRASRSINARIKDQLDSGIMAVEGGKRIAVTKRQAAVRSLIKQALAGDGRALKIVLDQARANEPKELGKRRTIVMYGDRVASDSGAEG